MNLKLGDHNESQTGFLPTSFLSPTGAPGSLEHIAYKCVKSNCMLLSNTSCTRTPIWIYGSLPLCSCMRPGLCSGPTRCLPWVLLGITELLIYWSCHSWLLGYQPIYYWLHTLPLYKYLGSKPGSYTDLGVTTTLYTILKGCLSPGTIPYPVAIPFPMARGPSN